MQRFVLEYSDSTYPHQLRETADAPRRLYGIGDPAALTEGLAIIGSRKATPYGLRAARMFAGWASRAELCVISGAAIGCDQAALEAAREAGGSSVAVLGCGADIDYPTGARELLHHVRSSGAVVSELPWGTTPKRWTFVRRNRIIAGLCRALLVVEAALPSGTFTTADFALAADRDVLVVPGSIFAAECRGSNRLLRQGAQPICDLSDLAFALGISASATQSDTEPGPGKVSAADAALLSALAAHALRPDDVATLLQTDIVDVVRRIGMLESAGLVERSRDGRYGVVPAEYRERRYNRTDDAAAHQTT